jgi:hypothetical protein
MVEAGEWQVRALIVKMVHDGQAPLRHPLGKYAVKKVRDTAASRLRELEVWEQAAGETDGPG